MLKIFLTMQIKLPLFCILLHTSCRSFVLLLIRLFSYKIRNLLYFS
jgi:hypothetical protein